MTISKLAALPAVTTFLLMPVLSGATTILVPQEQVDIQSGIDAASDGDTVLVGMGIYTGSNNRDLNFHGKKIVVVSANGRDLTFIDCEKGGRGFIFNSGEDTTSVVEGFTIMLGLPAQGVRGFPDMDAEGGGIYCSGSSPLISDCIFRNNTADFGGAVACLNGSASIFRDCEFMNNEAAQDGGAFYASASTPSLLTCKMEGNQAEGSGGGIFAGDSSSIEIREALLWLNSSGGNGGAVYSEKGTFTDFSISLVWSNTSDGKGGGAYLWDGSTEITWTAFAGNTAAEGGGGMFLDSMDVYFNQCTIADNNAGEDGGGIVAVEVDASVKNSIFWGDSPDEIVQTGGEMTLLYCDVKNGWEGSGLGNIDCNPLFCDKNRLRLPNRGELMLSWSWNGW